MIGTWRLNVGFGAFGAILTLLFSLSNNPVGTTFQRCFYAFVVFALIGFSVRLVLGQLMNPGAKLEEINISEEDRGAVLDLTTPDEGESLSELMKEQWADGKVETIKGFQPLQPQRLVSLDNPNPEQVVQAIRRLTDE
jgi:Na+/H+-dicarboxylate symporter